MKKAIAITLTTLFLGACSDPVVVDNNNNNNNNNPVVVKTPREVALTCFENMSENFHIHAYLRIFIDNVEQEIPANIGISYHCLRPLHTHDATGKIHIEAPEKMDFTIGDFFAVWGKTFSSTQILDSVVDEQHVIHFTVNAQPNQQFDSYVMQDGDQIEIRYQTL